MSRKHFIPSKSVTALIFVFMFLWGVPRGYFPRSDLDKGYLVPQGMGSWPVRCNLQLIVFWRTCKVHCTLYRREYSLLQSIWDTGESSLWMQSHHDRVFSVFLGSFCGMCSDVHCWEFSATALVVNMASHTAVRTVAIVWMLWKYFWKRTVLLRFYALTPLPLKDQVFVDVAQCRRMISVTNISEGLNALETSGTTRPTSKGHVLSDVNLILLQGGPG